MKTLRFRYSEIFLRHICSLFFTEKRSFLNISNLILKISPAFVKTKCRKRTAQIVHRGLFSPIFVFFQSFFNIFLRRTRLCCHLPAVSREVFFISDVTEKPIILWSSLRFRCFSERILSFHPVKAVYGSSLPDHRAAHR